MTKLIFSLLVLSQFVFALEKVSLQLLWKHQFEFAGFYIAKEKGFYKDVGLDITFKEYEFGVNIVQDVLSNKTNIGIGRSSLVLDKLKGKDVTLLFATFQNSPYVLISKKRDDLNSVQDFKNKRIMLSDDLESLAAISTMMKINNLSQDDYEVLQHSFEISDLINNNTDLMTTYLSNEPYYLEEQGVSYNVFNPKDYGISFYSDIVFTSKKFADTNPRLVQKFDEASLKGWKYAFENIDETIEIILQKYNSQNKTKDALKYEARILKGLAYQYGVELGDIDDLHIREIANLYRLLGMTNTSNHVLDEMIFEPFIFSNWIKQFFTLQMFLIVNSIILLVILMFSYKQYILRKATNILEKRVKKEVEKSRQHEQDLDNENNELRRKNDILTQKLNQLAATNNQVVELEAKLNNTKPVETVQSYDDFYDSLLQDDVDELHELLFDLDSKVVSMFDAKAEISLKNDTELSQLFKRFAVVLNSYQEFYDVAVLVLELSYALENPSIEIDMKEISLLLESLLFTMKTFNSNVFDNKIQNPRFYNASLLADITLVHNLLTNKENENLIEFF